MRLALPRFLGSWLCLLALSVALPARAVSGDELWADHWNRPGANDTVNDTIEFQGDLVAVGLFTFMGNVETGHVARYDGTAWTAVGSIVGGDVENVAVYQGQLYVAGYFSLDGGSTYVGLARWTGTQWEPVDGGIDAYVNDILVHGTQLVVIADDGISTWNGTSRTFIDGGFVDGYVYSGASDGTNLYVVGELYGIDTASVGNVARWNGSTWSSLGSGLTDDFGDPFNASAEFCHVWNGNLVVTGYFLHAGGQSSENVALWNGTSWSAIGPDPSYFADGAFTLGDFGGNLLVADNYGYVSQWNGSFWSLFSSNAFANDFEHWGSNLVLAGGTFGQISGVFAQNIALFDGSSWSALAPGDGASKGVKLVYDWNGTLVVGGTRSQYGPILGSLVAGWDGTQWTALGGPITATAFGGEATSATTYEGDLILGGSFTTADGTPANKIARFDGTNWSAMGGGSNATVHAMHVYLGDLYAGMAGTANPGYQVGRWNGMSWDPFAYTNDSIFALEEFEGKLYVGGNFSTIAGLAIPFLACWDGNGWSAPGGGLSGGAVWDLTVHGGRLYAAGQFTSAGGNSAERVAVFDGTSWAPLGAGVNNRVFGIGGVNGDIFITGEFIHSGGSPLDYVARWDGTQWDPMGSGLDARGWTLGVYGDELLVGGDFGMAGAYAAEGLSSWSSGTTAVPVLPASTFALRLAGPNPFGQRTALSFDLQRTEDVLFSIHDVRGRRVQRQLLRDLTPGNHLLPWDGRDALGREVAAGTYFVRIVAGGEIAARKLTVVR